MDEQIAQQIGFGVLMVALGAAGWLLPYRWNILRLKRLVAQMLSENAQQAVPKVVGTLLILVGVFILLGTAIIGSFE